MKKIILTILIFCMTMSFAACTETKTETSAPPAENTPAAAKSTPTPTPISTPTPADSKSGSKEASEKKSGKDWITVGKSVDFQDAIYTVNSVKKCKGTLFSAQDGKNYYLIDMTIKNNSKEEMAVSSIMLFDLIDSEGKTYDISLGGLTELQEEKIEQMDGSIPAGGEMKGGLGYETPENAKGLKLHIKSLFGKETATIELGK